MIGLSKLLAKWKTGSNKNAGLELLAYKAKSAFPDFSPELDEIACDICKLRERSTRINYLRAKLIAHTDLKAVLKPDKVEAVGFELIDRVLEEVYSITNRLSLVINREGIIFDYNDGTDTRIQTLCTHLNAGRDYLRENPERFKKYRR